MSQLQPESRNLWVKRFGAGRKYHLVTVTSQEWIDVKCGARGLHKSWVDRAEGPAGYRICKRCRRLMLEPTT